MNVDRFATCLGLHEHAAVDKLGQRLVDLLSKLPVASIDPELLNASAAICMLTTHGVSMFEIEM